MRKPLYIERALFIVGAPNAGKSAQLRSIFLDSRLGGKIPQTNKIKATYRISNDRGLYLRLTSPHELGETPEKFFKKIKKETGEGRWSIAVPLQPDRANKMPNVVETIRKFRGIFLPERVRVCFLSPDRRGVVHDKEIRPLINKLWKIDGVECIMIDATNKTNNGLFYSDFFDFS
jgi:hypothetical protein